MDWLGFYKEREEGLDVKLDRDFYFGFHFYSAIAVNELRIKQTTDLWFLGKVNSHEELFFASIRHD